MDVNKVTLLGNLTRDPGVKRLPSGQNLTFFRLATNYTWKDKEGRFQNRTNIVADNLVMLGHLGKKEPDELAKEEVNLSEVEVEE